MSYLRFSRPEYAAIAAVWDALDLEQPTPHAFRRLLAALVRGAWPDLAARVSRLRSQELRILCNHLRGRQAPRDKGHGLSAAEIALVLAAGGPLLLHARFMQPLRRCLVDRFRDEHPELATKLAHMSLRQFEELCRQVR